MLLPMGILAVASLVSGYVANPLGFSGKFLGLESHWFTEFVVSPVAHGVEKFSFPLATVSVGVAAVGVAFATAVYLWPRVSLGRLGRPFGSLHSLLSERYYIDHLYEGQIVSRGFYRGLAASLDWFDRRIVDNVAELAGWFSRNIGRAISLFQTGQVQGYGVAISLGAVLIGGAYLIWGRG